MRALANLHSRKWLADLGLFPLVMAVALLAVALLHDGSSDS